MLPAGLSFQTQLQSGMAAQACDPSAQTGGFPRGRGQLGYRIRRCLKASPKGGGGSERAQWVQELAAKPDHLGSIPGTHMAEGKN